MEAILLKGKSLLNEVFLGTIWLKISFGVVNDGKLIHNHLIMI